MNQPIIEVKNLGKKYQIGEKQSYLALRDTLTNLVKSPLHWLKGKTKGITETAGKNDFWALQDLNFEVQKGEVIGIIGKNGAGKSTLLKILSQITPPTTGEIKLRGRVGSLLEVGTGFHPELTGRENIYLNGSILGMNKKEIENKFDEIVEFSGIEKFLDTPVKRYSSGMYVRLAFAVAAHMDPEILIVDEVLAVGDAEFQKKCLGKMKDITSKGGRTILFVSHNMATIQNLCTRVILLNAGTIIAEGEGKTIIDSYLKTGEKNDNLNRVKREGNGLIKITDIIFKNKDGAFVNSMVSGEKMTIHIPYKTQLEKINNVSIGIGVDDDKGNRVSSLSSEYVISFPKSIPKSGSFVCELPKIPFNKGIYYITIIVRHNHDISDYIRQACSFQVERLSLDSNLKSDVNFEGNVILQQNWFVE